jgi:hypothetical protein
LEPVKARPVPDAGGFVVDVAAAVVVVVVVDPSDTAALGVERELGEVEAAKTAMAGSDVMSKLTEPDDTFTSEMSGSLDAGSHFSAVGSNTAS